MTLYLAESSGARILAYGTGITRVGTDYQLDVTTWDVSPMGEVGDVLGRSIDVVGTSDAGYALSVTPIVDGVNLAEQQFTSSATGLFQVQAYFASRGSNFAARVRTLSKTGSVELRNVGLSFVPIRATP